MEERKIEEAPWSIQQTILGTLFTLVPWMTLALSAASVQTPQPTTPTPPQIDLLNAGVVFVFAMFIEGSFLAAPLYFAYQIARSQAAKFGPTILRVLGLRRFDVRSSTLWIIALFVGLFLLNLLYSYLVTTFHLNIQTNDQVILARGKTDPFTVYATLLASVLIAPICEEIFFRGFVFVGLLRVMPVSIAVVVSALIFGIAHADLGSFPILFFIGIALAFLRWRTDSLWPSIILHLLNNFTGTLVIFLAMQGIIVF